MQLLNKLKAIFSKGSVLILLSLILSACVSKTNNTQGPLLVGPTAPVQSNQQGAANQQLQNASIFLDVAVPAFEPGFPIDNKTGEIDYAELDDEGIWPQLRRTEAKLFAIETKHALQREKVFGSVVVVPDTSTPSDLFVLGSINHSDSEVVGATITVVDSSGEIWGKQDFAHEVSANFFRDQRNKNKNPYEPLFNQISGYVVELLKKLGTEQKQQIKQMSLMRYARYYSPEAFGQYLESDIKRKNGVRYYKFELTGLPDQNDPMLQRIEALRAQELLFIDRLQDQYEVFDAQVGPSYQTWQEQTLPELEAARKATAKRNATAALGVGLGVLAAILSKNSGSSAGQVGAVLGGIGAAVAVNEAFKSNSAMKVHNAVIEEQGQAVDLSVGPTEMEFEDNTIELQGTATEQYMQWKTHLRKIYELESTPDTQL